MSSYISSSIQRIARGSFAYGLLPLVGLLTAPILARVLGPSGRGQLAAVLQPLTIIEAVLIAGVPTAVTYFVGRGIKFRNIKKQVFTLSSCTFIVAFIAIITYSQHIAVATGLNHIFILGVWSTCLIPLCVAVRRAIIQGYGHLGIIDLERVAIALLRLGSIFFLFWLGVNAVEPYIISYLLPGALAAIILFIPLRERNTKTQSTLQASPSVTKRAFYSYAILAGSSHVANILNARIDQAILPMVFQPEQLGVFSVAVTIAEIPLILSVVTARNLLSEASRGASKSALLKTTAIGTVFIIIVATTLWVLTPWATTLIFGSEYFLAGQIAQILLFGTIFSSVTASCGVILSGTGQPGKSLVAPAIGVVTFLVGFVVLGHQISPVHAAGLVLFSRIVSCACAACILYLALRPRNGLVSN